jgi:hypothetical protein
MEVGTRVEVRSRFEHDWARGFEVAEIVDAPDEAGPGGRPFDGPALRLRRRSDGQVLPVLFRPEDVREERRSRSMWWV